MEFTVVSIGWGSDFESFIRFCLSSKSVCIRRHHQMLLQWSLTHNPNGRWNSKKLAWWLAMEIGRFHMLVRNYGTYCQLLSVKNMIRSNSRVNWNPFWWHEETSSSAGRRCVSGSWYRGVVVWLVCGSYLVVLDFNLPKFLVVFIEVLCVWIVNKVLVMHSRARIFHYGGKHRSCG